MEAVPVSALAIGYTLATVILLSSAASRVADSGRIPVVAVKVVGARHVTSVRAGDTVALAILDSAARELCRALVDRGWLWAKVHWETTMEQRGVRVTFVARPGRLARVARWSLQGNVAFADYELAKELPRRGARFDRQSAKRALDAIFGYYERHGFPLAVVEAGALEETLDWVVPGLVIDEGPKVDVDFLAFVGVTATARSVLIRSARFQPGRPFSPTTVQMWRRSLERTGWLLCDSHALVTEDGRFGLQFWMKELAANRISGVAAYSAAEQLVGFLRFSLMNLLNTGRRLELGWRAQRGLSGYQLSYTEPWVFGSNISLTGGAEHKTLDTVQSRTAFQLTAALTFTGIGLGIESGWYRVTGDSGSTISATWAGSGISYDVRNGSPFYRSGVLLEAKTRVGTRARTGWRTHAIGSIEAGLHWLLPTAGSIVWSNRGNVRAVVCETTLATLELNALGGASSLRGFSEDEFLAPVVAWANSELGYLLSRSVQAYPFFDAGGYRQDDGWHLAAAYGIGVRWLARSGGAALDYGVGWGRDLLRGKVHVRLEGGF